MLVRSMFPDLVLADALPALDHVIFESRKKYSEMRSKIYRMESSDRWGEQHTGATGLGQPSVVNEGSPVRYDNPLQGFDKTYIHVDYGLGFKISHASARDNRWISARRMARELSRSFSDGDETLAASTFNLAFDTNFPGPDGVPLCSASHPLVKVGGVQSNVGAAADLDVDSLQLAYTAIALQKTHSGKPRRILPTRLLIHYSERFNAIEILKSELRSDTTNNATNAFAKLEGEPMLKIMPWTYLSDPDTWFLLANPEDLELYWFTRESLYTTHELDHDTRTLKTAAWEAHSFGWSDYIGIYGVPGA